MPGTIQLMSLYGSFFFGISSLQVASPPIKIMPFLQSVSTLMGLSIQNATLSFLWMPNWQNLGCQVLKFWLDIVGGFFIASFFEIYCGCSEFLPSSFSKNFEFSGSIFLSD